MLIAGDSLRDDQKRFPPPSGTYHQVHFMMTGFLSCVDVFRTIVDTFSLKNLMFTTRMQVFRLSSSVTPMRQMFPLYGKVLSSYVIVESLYTEIRYMSLFLQYAHGGVGRKTVYSYQTLQRLKKWVSRM